VVVTRGAVIVGETAIPPARLVDGGVVGVVVVEGAGSGTAAAGSSLELVGVDWALELRPGVARAATADSTPAVPSAPAANQAVRRDTRRSPSSRPAVVTIGSDHAAIDWEVAGLRAKTWQRSTRRVASR